MKSFVRIACLGLLLLMIVGPALAQGEPIALEPFTDDLYEVQGVKPSDWTKVAPGIYARASSMDDRTSLVAQAALTTPSNMMSAIMPQLGLSELPAPSGTRDANGMTWTLYEAQAAQGGVVDFAFSEDSGRTYVVMLIAMPEDHEMYYNGVFLPAVDALMPLAEATPEPGSVPYTSEEVTFENGDITLAGTLTLPPGDGPHPAVVLVTGSGPEDRDELIAPMAAIKPFRLIADYLSRNGIAVLRYDDRGTAESTGDFATATTSDFASDAAAALDFLHTRADINHDQVGLLGHSEGGLVATMLGARENGPAFIITLSGPGVVGVDLLLKQNERLLRAGGATDEQVQQQLDFLQQAFPLAQAQRYDELRTMLHDAITEQANQLPEAQRQAMGDNLQAQIDRTTDLQMQSLQSPWMAQLLSYDPGPDWEKIQVPVLALFGEKDVQVDADQNAPAVQAALDRGGNTDHTIIVYPDANHLFQSANTGGVQEYATLDQTFVPDLLPDITAWILDRVDVTAEVTPEAVS